MNLFNMCVSLETWNSQPKKIMENDWQVNL